MGILTMKEIQTILSGLSWNDTAGLQQSFDTIKAALDGDQKPATVLYELNDAEKALVRYGQKIPAIKELRARIGCGLKEAKDSVEAYKF